MWLPAVPDKKCRLSTSPIRPLRRISPIPPIETKFDRKVRASSRDFDHFPYFIGFWRPFPVFPSLKSSPEFARLHLSSTEFDAIRSRSNPIIPPRRADEISPRILLKLSTNHFLKTTLSPLRRRTLKANNEPPRISPHRLMAAGAIRINSFQDVKDHLSSSGFAF